MLESLRLQLIEILNVELVNNSFIYLSLWSFIHLIFGMWIMYFILKLSKNKKDCLKFLLLFVSLILYEIFEFYAMRTSTLFLIVETWQNTTWDLIVGMLGGFMIMKINNWNLERFDKEKWQE